MTKKDFTIAADQIIAAYKYWEFNYDSRAYKAMIREIMILCNSQGKNFDLVRFKSYLKKNGIDYDAMPD